MSEVELETIYYTPPPYYFWLGIDSPHEGLWSSGNGGFIDVDDEYLDAETDPWLS